MRSTSLVVAPCLLFASLLLGAVACGDDDGSSGGGDATVGSTGAGGECVPGAVCAPPAPADWSGPSARVRAGSTPPACPAAYLDSEAVFYAELEVQSGGCICSCTPQ